MESTPLVASRYNTFAPSALPDTYLAFNAFTGALLELTEEESAFASALEPGQGAPSDIPLILRRRLCDAGILVPRAFDERQALFDIRRRAIEAPDSMLLTIAPTIQCNFRCTYCFEAHRQEVMTPAVEADLIRFIAARSVGVRAISTTWFGGEPLLQPEILERVQRFINDLGRARGIAVSRGIVTNGYFLTPAMIDRLRALGSWSMVQVTIDGVPEVHDARRMLLGGGGTWSRIVANCRAALAAGLRFNLRVNVDRSNADSLALLIDRLAAEGLLPDVHVSLGFVTDATDACAHVKNEVMRDEDRARIAIWFDAELMRRGFLPGGGLPSPLCGPVCSVESKLGFVVAPSGLVFKCWNQIDRSEEEAIGHVSGRSVPNADAEAARWQRYDPSLRKGCSNCHALPVCMGGCPWEYERLQRVDRGECETFKFFPKDVVAVAHVRRRAQHQAAVGNADVQSR